jgi:biopolymer transport protein ExbD
MTGSGPGSRRIRRRLAAREPIELAMTPMIDVVFLLLIFFLATASFQRLELALPGSLASPPAEPLVGGSQLDPTPERELLSDVDDMVVRMEYRGDEPAGLWLDQQPVESLEALERHLQRVVEIGLDVPLVVDPDPQVRLGETIQVYDLARRVGVGRVFFAVR